MVYRKLCIQAEVLVIPSQLIQISDVLKKKKISTYVLVKCIRTLLHKTAFYKKDNKLFIFFMAEFQQ